MYIESYILEMKHFLHNFPSCIIFWLTSVPKKIIPSVIVYYYCNWYYFFRNRCYVVWYWFPNCVIYLVLLTQIRFLSLDNGSKLVLKFYIFWLIILGILWSSIKMVQFFEKISRSLLKCGLINNLIPLCLNKRKELSWN